MKELVILTDAVRMLAEAKSLDEIKHIHGLAKVAEAYAKAEKLGMEAEAHAAEIRLRAARKAGEALIAAGIGPGRPEKELLHEGIIKDANPKLPDLGISLNQSSDWKTIAQADEKDFEKALAKAKEKKVTSDRAVAKMLRKPKRTSKPADTPGDPTPAEEPTPVPEGVFNVLYVNPPYHDKTLDEIASFPVTHFADKNAILFIWTTDENLPEMLNVVEMWDFKYQSHLVWDKDTLEDGHYSNMQHELLLICLKGFMPEPKKDNKPDSVLRFMRYEEGHDKPDDIYEMIEAMYPSFNKVGLFTNNMPGWTRWIG